MAGAIPGFAAAAVREGLRLPMRMGLPVDEAQWPTFVTPGAVTAPEGGMDAHGVPWDPAATPVREPDSRVHVVCAVEWESGGVKVEHFGTRQPEVAVITLLDEEWAKVRGFEYVELFPAGTPVRFHYRKVRGRYALDVVEVFEIECSTEDVA
jgi:hypothetical protein